MWQAPECNNLPITGYKIYISNKTIERADGIKLSGEKGSRVIAELPADKLEHRIDGLTAATAYYVEVFAVNEQRRRMVRATRQTGPA